jgi:hypothetical protein
MTSVGGDVAKQGMAAADRRAEWRERLRRFERSGKSVAEFCKAESVSAWSLYDWRRRLGAVGRVRGGEARDDGGFVDAGAIRMRAGKAKSEMPSEMELRIELGGGLVLQILRR